MKRSSIFLLILGLCLLWSAPLYAGSDEYLGDSNIYAGVPTELTRPNVLLIIDNSRATLHTAAGYAYDPNTEYPRGESCEEGKDDPQNGCYLPWNIYEQDNQGDFAQYTFNNSSSDLTTLKCDPTNGDKEILYFFQNYGTYSGTGMDPFPNLKSDGGCEYKSFGRVYALGNYLNYVQNAQGDDRVGQIPGEEIVECRGDIVSYCSEFLPNGNCKNNATGYYECIKDHTNVNPITGDTGDENYPWSYIGTSTPTGTNPTAWSATTSYKAGDCNSSEDVSDENVQTSGATQRQIIYEALEQVIKDTKKYVNFGAMSYGQNHGGKLINHMTDLSSSDILLNQFLEKIPGGSNGEGVLNSNTLRPQAESLFDAGWYYGAQYTPINIDKDPSTTTKIPENIKNVCGLNHIILLTNGFTLSDNFPGLGSGAPENVIGDADGDKYPDEYVYGQGSHWLDDVAKHLRENYDIKTHTVLAFQAIDDLVMNAAKDGDGQFYNVYNKDELANALRKLLINIINESSTSFVAPVVPSSTTNRTISSNNVYLGLFRPQGEGDAWHGNIKKYKISPTTLQLLGVDGTPATDIYGNFDDDSISYWSLAANNKVPTSTTEDGYIDPAGTDPNKPRGDGGEVSAGGAGGVLLEKMRGLVAAIRADGSSWYPTGQTWRNIYTYLGTTKDLNDSRNIFSPDNGNITVETLDLSDLAGNPLPADHKEKDNLIRFVHGFVDEGALPMTPATAEIRDWVLGDILHSKPVVFNYSKYVPSAENQCYAFDGETDLTKNSSIIFAGANDGMLHAFRDCDGQELWAFIPPNALSTLQYFKEPQSGGHATFVDSAPSLLVHDTNNNGTIEANDDDKVVLVFGQRRGGGTNILDEASSRGAYYALDVTNPLDPQFLWEVDSDNLGEIGETWSQPRLAKVPVDSSNFKIVAFVGAGYDNNEDLRYGDTRTFPDSTDVDINMAESGGEVDGSGFPQTSTGDLTADNRHAPRGRGIMAIEVATLTKSDATLRYKITLPSAGTVYWDYTFADNNQLKYSFPGDLAVLDMNGDSYADTIYTGDTGGNLWKFNVGGADTTSWSGQILFQSNAGADDSNGRKIFYRPEIAYVGAPHIYFGTGDREHPLNRAVVDRMYCVIDWGAQGTYPVTEAALVDATDNTLQDPDTTKEVADALLSKMLSSPSSPYLEGSENKFTYGWYIKLDGVDRTGELDLGEKVLAPATVFNGEVFFSTYQLETGPRTGCDAGNMGISRLYHLNYRTAEAVMNYNLTNDDLLGGGETDGETPAVNERSIGENGEILDRSDRTRDLGEGIPSGIVTLIDASGNVTQLISSSDKVEAMAAPDIKLISPVYWMQW